MTKKTFKKQLKGIVVSDKMLKTRVAAVTFLKRHPIYKKTYKLTNRYKAHDENNEYKTGDQVMIQECRPLSREKRWRIIKKI